VRYAKTAEPIDMPFGLWTQVGPRRIRLNPPSMCGGNVAFFIQLFCRLFAFYSARNARIASAVLATAIPSVLPSVTRWYCVKTTARSTVQFAPLDSEMCLVL